MVCIGSSYTSKNSKSFIHMQRQLMSFIIKVVKFKHLNIEVSLFHLQIYAKETKFNNTLYCQ